jgi:hypothetical protein
MEFNEQVKDAAKRLANKLSLLFSGPHVGIANENGRTVLVVYLSNRRHKRDIPQEWEGYPVRIDYAGRFNPLSDQQTVG